MRQMKKIILFLSFILCFLSISAYAADTAPDPEQAGMQGASAALTRAEATASALKVAVTTDRIHLDGEAVKPAGYNINGNNYFKLRDIAYLMSGKKDSFGVDWDAASNSISLTSGTAYQPIGGELSGTSGNAKIVASSANVLLDGQKIHLTAYNIDGNNYFKLRDVGTEIGFAVDYDETNKIILLESGESETYTVSFAVGSRGTPVSPLRDVKAGSSIAEPAAPAASGYSFDGWYKDEDGTDAWNFASDTVTADITLYARWAETYTVSFDMGGYGSQIASLTGVKAGDRITAPVTPAVEGYVFVGWYRENSFANKWDFGADTVQSSLTLFAAWDKDNGQTPETPVPGTPDNSSAVDGVMTIVLDPGHGGSDGGGASKTTGQNENTTNLAVAQYLQQMLESAGAKVYMTRTDTTTTITPTERKAHVQRLCAQGDIDLVVSIHHNSFNGVASGAELLVQPLTMDATGRSQALGKMILDEYRRLGQGIRGTVDRPGLYMLSAPAEYGVPAVMSEFCFLDNDSDLAMIDTPEKQYAEAQAIYQALMTYFETYPY